MNAPNSVRPVTVLSVSPVEADHSCLEDIFRHSKWVLRNARTLFSARLELQRDEIAVVLCERDLMPGTWKDLLNDLALVPKPPVMMVMSRFADEILWSEVLNSGVYDLLSKPLDHKEVTRAVSLAWLHWKHQHESPGVPERAFAASQVP